MAKYQVYAEYKDSGVEWLGAIPKDWELKKHKYIAVFSKGKNPEPLLDNYSDGLYPYLSMDSLRGKADSKYAEYKKGLVLVQDNQPLIIWDGSNSGEFVLGRKGLLSSTMASACLIYEIQDKYYWYLCVCIEPEMRKHATGMGIPHVNGEELRGIVLPLPELNEQTQIAKFLDHETTKIDHLIEKQHQLIELLKEKRQAVISHAVTKGLNPNVPMKDSGVEWLGQVPEHWGITPLKHQVETINGFGFSSNDFCDEGVPFIRAGNIKQKSINNVEIFLPQEIVNKYKRVILSAGDVVISMVGSDPTVKESAVGQIGIIPTHFEGAVPNQNVVILREKKCNLLKKYLFYSLCSTAYRTHLDIFSHKLANQAIISSSLIISAKFTMPRVDEQLEIINYLDNQLLKFDQMMLKAESAIQLMQERRTALISAAVTGKIDVRNWQAPMVAEAQTELSA